MVRHLETAAAAVAAILVAAPVLASTPEAWEKFRAELAQGCTKAANMPAPRMVVAPEGTPSYGVAILTSDGAGGGPPVTLVCIMRKTPEGLTEVEITPPASEWIAIK